MNPQPAACHAPADARTPGPSCAARARTGRASTACQRSVPSWPAGPWRCAAAPRDPPHPRCVRTSQRMPAPSPAPSALLPAAHTCSAARPGRNAASRRVPHPRWWTRRPFVGLGHEGCWRAPALLREVAGRLLLCTKGSPGMPGLSPPPAPQPPTTASSCGVSSAASIQRSSSRSMLFKAHSASPIRSHEAKGALSCSCEARRRRARTYIKQGPAEEGCGILARTMNPKAPGSAPSLPSKKTLPNMAS